MNHLLNVSDVQRFSLAMIGRRKSMILEYDDEFDDALVPAKEILRGGELPETETSMIREEWLSSVKLNLFYFLQWDVFLRLHESRGRRRGEIGTETIRDRVIQYAKYVLLDLNPSFVPRRVLKRKYSF